MDGNKYLKGSELGAAASDYVSKDAPAEEAVEESTVETSEEESSESEGESSSDSEPEVVWRNTSDSQGSQ